MKKVLIIFAALAMVFGLSMSAAADPCIDCNKCDLLNIPCPTLTGQDRYECTYFDWESGEGSCQYELKLITPGYQTRNCAALFYVCECPGFTSGGTTVQNVGVRMGIIQGDGVYFMDDNITVKAYTTNANDAACFREGAYSSHSFVDVQYYANTSCTGTEVNAAVCVMGDVALTNKAKGIKTATEITPLIITSNTPYWIVDIPTVTVDKDEYVPGQVVKVRVELIGSSEDGFCATCNILCTCDYDIGVMCCDVSTQNCIYFPYVKVNDPWACGVVVVATEPASYPVSAMNLTLELMDATGATFTATFAAGSLTSPFFIRVLNAATMAELGWAPAPGAALLKFYSDSPIDGYTFLTNGDFGGSVLARECSWTASTSMIGALE